MTRHLTHAAVTLFVLVFVSVVARADQGFTDEDESTCVSCHDAEPDVELAASVPEWRESVHAEALVSCDACHGGDARLEDGDEVRIPPAR